MTPENIREMYTAVKADPDGNGKSSSFTLSTLDASHSRVGQSKACFSCCILQKKITLL